MPADPELVESLRKEAIARRANREYTLALASLENALSLTPDNAEVLRELGRTLSYFAAETGDDEKRAVLLDRAEAALKQALSLPGASRAKCLHDLAWLYDERGDYAEAVELYRKAVADNAGREIPEAALAYNLACALVKAGEEVQALDALEPVIGDAWKWAEKDPDFAPLRSSAAWGARFAELLSEGRRLKD